MLSPTSSVGRLVVEPSSHTDESRPDSLRGDRSLIASVSPRQTTVPSDESPDRLMVATSAFASDSSEAEESEAEKKISCKKSSNNKKKVERKSNRYHDKTKAKAHLGACVTGGIAMGVLAGPIGLVFAAVYINAMCVTMYGGSQFVTGDKKENKKPEEELPQESTSPHPTANSDPLRPEPASQPEQDDGKGEGEADRSYYNKVNSDNFTFAPVISSGDNITINGNIYLYPSADYQPTPNADHTSKNAATQTSEQASETLVQEQDRSVFVTNITQVPSPSIEQTGPLDETVKQILVDPSAKSQLFHCTFSDGMNAYLRADPHLITPTKVATHQQHIHQQQVGTPSSPPTGFLGWVKNGKNDSWIQTNQFTPVQTTEGPIRGKNYEADAGLNLSSGERSHNAPPVSLSSNQGNQDPLDDDDSTALKFTTEKVRTAELKYRNDAQLSTISSRPMEETHSVGSGNSGLSEQHSSEKPENEPALGKLPETEKHHLYKEENLVTSDRILTGLDSSATTGSLGWVKGEDNSGWKQTNQFTPVQTTEGPIRGKNYEADAGSSINSGERLHNAPSVSLSSNQGSTEPLSDDDFIELQSTTNEVKGAELISRNDTSEPLSDDDFIELQSTTNEVKVAELISRSDSKGSLVSSKVSSKEDIPEKKETAFLSEHILSGGWKFEVQGGKARWVNVQASNSNTQQRPVILSAGSAISGVAQNYTQGIFANVKDLDESRRESFHKLQEGVSVKQLSEFNIINGKAERPLDKQNIAYVA